MRAWRRIKSAWHLAKPGIFDDDHILNQHGHASGCQKAGRASHFCLPVIVPLRYFYNTFSPNTYLIQVALPVNVLCVYCSADPGLETSLQR